ncbi:MAG: hypothetical protein IT167_31175 [Bryobacterales bacterium]|nr:hypothetical protein [Bryobacterales bacterium]
MKLLPFLLFAAMQPAPNHSVPFDTDLVRVVTVTEKPGPPGKLHKHDVNRVMIYLDAGQMRLNFKDTGPKDLNVTPGAVRWDPAGGLHTSQTLGSKSFRIVEVEIKKSHGSPVQFPALDPVRIDPKHYKVELENDQVRVIRAKFEAGYQAPMHEHTLPRVAVYLTDYQLKVTGADGKMTTPHGPAGQVLLGGPSKHTELNTSGKPFEVLVVELKTR